jgi:hypothetical protein
VHSARANVAGSVPKVELVGRADDEIVEAVCVVVASGQHRTEAVVGFGDIAHVGAVLVEALHRIGRQDRVFGEKGVEAEIGVDGAVGFDGLAGRGCGCGGKSWCTAGQCQCEEQREGQAPAGKTGQNGRHGILLREAGDDRAGGAAQEKPVESVWFSREGEGCAGAECSGSEGEAGGYQPRRVLSTWWYTGRSGGGWTAWAQL